MSHITHTIHYIRNEHVVVHACRITYCLCMYVCMALGFSFPLHLLKPIPAPDNTNSHRALFFMYCTFGRGLYSGERQQTAWLSRITRRSLDPRGTSRFLSQWTCAATVQLVSI